jgi:hypothetical protein
MRAGLVVLLVLAVMICGCSATISTPSAIPSPTRIRTTPIPVAPISVDQTVTCYNGKLVVTNNIIVRDDSYLDYHFEIVVQVSDLKESFDSGQIDIVQAVIRTESKQVLDKGSHLVIVISKILTPEGKPYFEHEEQYIGIICVFDPVA